MTVTKYNVGDKLYQRQFLTGGIVEYTIVGIEDEQYLYTIQLNPGVYKISIDSLDVITTLYKNPEDVPGGFVVKTKPKKNARCIN